jgi:hypothetical protein
MVGRLLELVGGERGVAGGGDRRSTAPANRHSHTPAIEKKLYSGYKSPHTAKLMILYLLILAKLYV